MTLANYTELVAEIESRLKRSDKTAAIPGYIRLCEEDIYNELRVWHMRSVETLNITSGVPEVALPDGTLEVKWVKLLGASERELRRLPPSVANELYANATSGSPRYYRFDKNQLYLEPTPSEDATCSAMCLIAPTALSESNPINDILTHYPNIYLQGSLKHAYADLRNPKEEDRSAVRFKNAIDRANLQTRRQQAAGTSDGVRSRRRVP